jgi:predicted nucleotidyltransferase
VTVDEAGSSLLYTLNREHLLAPAILLLTDARAALWERITREIGQWSSAPRHVSVFGSAARGDGGTSSDIDVFIVRPNSVTKDDSQWRAQIESLAADVYRWTGNRAGIAEVSDRELARLRREQPPVAESLRSDAITLVGPPAGELLSRRC